MFIAAVTAYWKGLLKLLLFMPALLLFKSLLGSEMHLLLWTGILSLFYVAGFLFRAVWPVTTTGLYGFSGVIISFCLGFVFFDLSLSGILQTILGTVLFFRGGFLVVLGWGEPVSPNLYWISLFLYFVSSIMYRHYAWTETLVPLVNSLGIVTLFITLFAINRYLLSEVSLLSKQEKFQPASHLLIPNLILLSMLSLIILFISGSNYFAKIWDWIWSKIRITSTSQQGSVSGGEESTASTPLRSGYGVEEPALWLQILDRLLQIIGVIILIIISVVVFYIVFKSIFHLFVKLWNILKKKIWHGEGSLKSEQTQAYKEEQKNLWNWTKVRPWAKKRTTKKRRLRWRDLKTNEERIRYLFREWLKDMEKKGKMYQVYETPAEFIHKNEGHDWIDFVQLYYRVRYGKYVPTDEEVILWKNLIQK